MIMIIGNYTYNALGLYYEVLRLLSLVTVIIYSMSS